MDARKGRLDAFTLFFELLVGRRRASCPSLEEHFDTGGTYSIWLVPSGGRKEILQKASFTLASTSAVALLDCFRGAGIQFEIIVGVGLFITVELPVLYCDITVTAMRCLRNQRRNLEIFLGFFLSLLPG